MICQNCGKNMPDGARFCISCGAEHNANGRLVINNNQVDYNKTMMANDIPVNKKIDYDKTVMATDVYSKSNNKIDYNKTMMANDAPISENKSNDKINSKKKKKFSPIILVVILILILSLCYKIFLSDDKKNTIKINDSVNVETIQETTTNGNVVSDFDSSEGYWSNDAEFFYKNGTVQTNQWIGEYYVGDDGRKVRNVLIDDTYYVDATGKIVKNQWYKFTRNISGENVIIWYYLGADGAKLKDTLTPDGYYVDANGMYIPGVYDSPDSKVYIPNN